MIKKKVNLFYIFIFLIFATLAEGVYIFLSNTKELSSLEKFVFTNSSKLSAASILSSSDISALTTTTASDLKSDLSLSSSTTTASTTATEITKSIVPKVSSKIIIKPKTTTIKIPANPNDKIPPTIPVITSGKVISDTQINITWNASTDNYVVAGYNVYQDGVKIGTTESTKFAFTKLSSSTLYAFSVSAFDDSNNTSLQSKPFSLRTDPKKVVIATTTPDLPILPIIAVPAPVQTPAPDPIVPPPPPPAQTQTQTPAPDITPPSAPTNLTVTSVTTSQVNLSWNASTDNIAVTNYDIYRNGSKIASVSGISYSDSGLTPSTSYNYTIYAFDAAGNISPQSGSVSVTTKSNISSTATTTATTTKDN